MKTDHGGDLAHRTGIPTGSGSNDTVASGRVIREESRLLDVTRK